MHTYARTHALIAAPQNALLVDMRCGCCHQQGSGNGKDWTLLRRHTNDCSLDGPFATNSWSLETDTPYRFFRILQTGHNSSSHNFLVVSGIELYGDLYQLIDPTVPEEEDAADT
jgi:hypothetical protein